MARHGNEKRDPDSAIRVRNKGCRRIRGMLIKHQSARPKPLAVMRYDDDDACTERAARRGTTTAAAPSTTADPPSSVGFG